MTVSSYQNTVTVPEMWPECRKNKVGGVQYCLVLVTRLVVCLLCRVAVQMPLGSAEWKNLKGIESAPCFVSPLMSINVLWTSWAGFGMRRWLQYKDGSERYVPPHAARSSDTFLWEQVSHAGEN